MSKINTPPSTAGAKKTGQKEEYKSQYKSKTAELNPEQLRKLRGFQMMIGGAVFLIVPCLELYRRLYAGGERRIQHGEFNPVDGSVKDWEEEEKIRNFKDSWLTKLFGEK